MFEKRVNLSHFFVSTTLILIFSILVSCNVISWKWIPGSISGSFLIIFRFFFNTKIIDKFTEKSKKAPRKAKQIYLISFFLGLIATGIFIFIIVFFSGDNGIFNIFSFLISSVIIILTTIICSIIETLK